MNFQWRKIFYKKACFFIKNDVHLESQYKTGERYEPFTYCPLSDIRKNKKSPASLINAGISA